MGADMDLVQRLQAAAGMAIADLRTSLEHRPESIRGVTLEFTVTPARQLRDVVSFIERRDRVNAVALLDDHRGRAQA
jgi:hypothetical protein